MACRRAPVVRAVACVLASSSLCVHALSGTALAVPRSYATEIATREALAGHQAAAQLASLALPPGSAQSAAEPAGDGGFLAHPSFDASGALRNVVGEHRWWIVPGAPAQVLAYVHEHLPSGATWRSGAYPPADVPPHESAILRWPERAGLLGERVLTLRVAQLSASQTGVRADAQVLWLVPAVQVPQGARVLRVTARLSGPRHGSKRTVTVHSARLIGKLTGLINAAHETAPSFLPRSCPAGFGTVSLTFLRRAGGPPLAKASVSVGGCGGVIVQIPGRLPVPRESSPQLIRALEPPLGLALP